MAENCLFCRMVSGAIRPDILYEDADLFGFKDINPQAPLHVLVIPKRHIATLNDLTADDAGVMGKLLYAATQVARQAGVSEAGYRVVMNCNADAGQSVFHVHMHVLGGRHMKWPPG